MMTNKIKTLLALSFALLANEAQAQDYMAPKDAAKMVNSKAVIVIDCNKAEDYAKVHIINAISIWHEDLYKEGAVEGLIKQPEELARVLGTKGIAVSNPILLYDAGSNKYSGRLYWILKYLGAKDVKIIDGGMGEWQKNRLPVTKNPHKLASTTFEAAPNKDFFAIMPQVKRAMSDPKTILVDVRDLNEYNGTAGATKRKGHIPGAINFEYKNVQNEAGVIKTKEELEKLFASAGITPDKEVILYCTTSVRAGVVFMVLKSILNFPNVKIYDGAFNEWEANVSNPVK